MCFSNISVMYLNVFDVLSETEKLFCSYIMDNGNCVFRVSEFLVVILYDVSYYWKLVYKNMVYIENAPG